MNFKVYDFLVCLWCLRFLVLITVKLPGCLIDSHRATILNLAYWIIIVDNGGLSRDNTGITALTMLAVDC